MAVKAIGVQFRRGGYWRIETNKNKLKE